MANKVYLITGANGGIGRGLVAGFLSRSHTTVIAAVRNPADATSSSLKDFPRGDGSKIEVVTLNTPADYSGLAATLAAKEVHQLDVVVANAGGYSGFKPSFQTTPEDVLFDLEINSVLPVRAFLSTWPLLEKAGTGAKFVIMGSVLGSIGNMPNMNLPGVGYGMSKAAAHFYGKKLALDYAGKGLHVGILHPGWTRTTLGQDIANSIGFKEPSVPLEDSVKGSIKIIDDLNATSSGQFQVYDGSSLPW